MSARHCLLGPGLLVNTTFIVSQFSVAFVAEIRGMSALFEFVPDGMALSVL